ncbi:hypothetical protein Cpir12675_006100 [Ceratocystis pirilliformis]|uniref:Luciferase-like domain-containing protein n=1 Tax=Ceratocystis pirilliformis TaxID=259994 RepID=A0ABR3YLE2_9PEZI
MSLARMIPHGANSESAIRTGCQFPIGDPTIPVAAMAAATKRIRFIVTTSPFHEVPTITARRFSTINHVTGGRFSWNVTTQLNASTARSLGLPVVDSEKVHEVAGECLDVLYKIDFVGGTSRTPKWTPQNLGKLMAVGGNGAVAVGSAQRVADTMEDAVVTPVSFEDVVDLLAPELQPRGLYPKRQENGTLRERVYGIGQKYLRSDRYGSTMIFTDS